MLTGQGHALQASGMRGADIVPISFVNCAVVSGLQFTAAAATVLHMITT
jgi:hypothetical protein